MTEPVNFNASLNYTPYDAEDDFCHSEGTGGVRGAEGAAGTPNSPPAPEETQNCTTEVMKAAGTCGGAILAGRFLPPTALFGALSCLATIGEVVECVAEPEPRASGR